MIQIPHKGQHILEDIFFLTANTEFHGKAISHRIKFQDLAVAKIAEIMSISEGTVKSHLFRAKQKLGEYLKKNGYE